jgi:hypothetical protein
MRTALGCCVAPAETVDGDEEWLTEERTVIQAQPRNFSLNGNNAGQTRFSYKSKYTNIMFYCLLVEAISQDIC